MSRTLDVALANGASIARVQQALRLVNAPQLEAMRSASVTLTAHQPAMARMVTEAFPMRQSMMARIATEAFSAHQLRMAPLVTEAVLARQLVMTRIATEAVKAPWLGTINLFGGALGSQLVLKEALKPVTSSILASGIHNVLRQHSIQVVEALRRAVEDQQRAIKAIHEYADALERDPREEYRHAGAFLRKAVRGFEEAVEAEEDDEYTFADVIHWAVGALEEVVCQLPGVRSKTLGKALAELEKSGAISPEDRKWIEEVYTLRSRERGIGHGAGDAPEYAARYVLFRVRWGLAFFLPGLFED